jgi:LacI family transcriptional regulator
MKQNQAALPDEDRLPIFRTETTIREDFLPWFARHKPDAMIGRTRQMCDWAREEGWEVPRQFGFATFDWDFEPNRAAGLRQRRGEIGATAINLLFQLLQEHQYGESSFDRGVLIPGHWADGPTV